MLLAPRSFLCYKENNRLYNKTPQLSFMDVELCVICGRVQIWRFSLCSPLNVQMSPRTFRFSIWMYRIESLLYFNLILSEMIKSVFKSDEKQHLYHLRVALWTTIKWAPTSRLQFFFLWFSGGLTETHAGGESFHAPVLIPLIQLLRTGGESRVHGNIFFQVKEYYQFLTHLSTYKAL